jgi:NADPH:quinone reductase-like Zn-dependent oxidoreductase
MRTAVFTTYGGPEVVTVQDRPKPVISETQVLVRVHAVVVTAADVAARSGSPFIARLYFGLRRPKLSVLGSDFAGEIAAVGASVTAYRVGDRVQGSTGASLGAHAEYLAVEQDSTLTPIPANVSFGDAVAAFEGAMTALPFLRDAARLRSGQRILINGASGSVGSAAVQIAHGLGAHVTAVCSEANAELVRSIGADDVVDYAREDFTSAQNRYDVIFDAVGKSSFVRARRALTGNGIYLTTVPTLAIMVRRAITANSTRKRAGIVFAGLLSTAEAKRNIAEISALVTAGTIVPVIDRTFPVAEIAEAHRLVDTCHKRGNVVVTF